MERRYRVSQLFSRLSRKTLYSQVAPPGPLSGLGNTVRRRAIISKAAVRAPFIKPAFRAGIASVLNHRTAAINTGQATIAAAVPGISHGNDLPSKEGTLWGQCNPSAADSKWGSNLAAEQDHPRERKQGYRSRGRGTGLFLRHRSTASGLILNTS